jgi:hypothetical protein
MKYFSKIFQFLVFLTITSCQINQVLEPWKNSIDKKEFSWKEGNDSLKLKISGENLQPEFLKNNKTLVRDFNIKSFYFKTKEGRKLNAWMLQSNTEKPKASIFALHGNAGNLNTQFQNFSDLTKKGFQIFIFDYSGFGYSEGNATRKNALEDAFSAFHFFENLDEVKNTPKIIYGQSFGGNLAIPVATENQQKIEGLVIEGTFMNVKNIANRKLPVLGGFMISNNYNNKQNLKNFKKSILIIHSKEDRVVNFKLGKQIFKNANQPKEFFEIDKPHINGIRFYHNEISKKIDSLILKK